MTRGIKPVHTNDGGGHSILSEIGKIRNQQDKQSRMTQNKTTKKAKLSITVWQVIITLWVLTL